MKNKIRVPGSRLWTRRHVMGAAAAGLAAPLFPLVPLLDARGEVDPAPKRILILHSPNGIAVLDRWRPKGGETDFELGEILGSLEPHRSDLIVIDGLYDANYGSPGGHLVCQADLLTGRRGNTIDGVKETTRGSGISVDQRIADVIGGDTPFPSIQLGILADPSKADGPLESTMLSYRGSRDYLLPENDPYAAFDRLFAGVDPAEGANEAEARRLDAQSILDRHVGDLSSLRTGLGADDRLKLDQHLDALRALEKTLQPSGGSTGSCELPMVGSRLDTLANDNIPVLCQLQVDIAAAALACNLTHVATLQLGCTGWNAKANWLNLGRNIHGLNHNQDYDGTVKWNQWVAEHVFAYILQRLKAIPEGTGTLLDHTLVLWANEFGDGDKHSNNPMPFVLAGKAGGALRTGRYLRYDHRPHNDLLLSMCHAMDVLDDTFGEPKSNTGPLSELA